jgi:two-component system CheB/CheR fusion protein
MSKGKDFINNTPSSIQFPVVGIGASAGGLEAIKQFLRAIPVKTGMAFVFVQHLSPTHVSSLPEILAKFSKIPVRQIADNIHIEIDHFYIVPANKIVKAEDGVLKLDTLDDKRHKVKVIDLFFSSLAVVHQSFAVGIVLSGTLNDGALGLQVIKSYGGITFAQDVGSAAFDGMPKNAVNTGAVDFVLPPDKIVEHLISINRPFRADYSKQEIANTVPQQDENTFKQVLAVLRVRRGVDFSYYKPGTLKRRIVRRMALANIAKPEEYLNYLRENKPEQDTLYNDLLISVTNFFRDPASFELLCDTIFPALIKRKRVNEALRIWIAGCATGEEAYSMAICLQEHLGDKAAAMKIQLFATDISETAIAKARTGIYRATDLEGLSSSRVQQFFTKLDGSYQVNKVIRDMCVFAHHNLLKDPPFSKIDLVSCRNVLIYLEPVLQKRALQTFHYALNEQGFLMLGKSENIGNNTDLFSAYNSHEKIFSRKGERGRFMAVTSPGSEQHLKDIDKGIQIQNIGQDIFKIAGDIILSKYAPSSVLANERFDIIQFYGKTDTWLTMSAGRASFNLLKMAREGLAFELRSLLYLAKKKNETARKENVLFNLNGSHEYVNIEVVVFTSASEPHYLVLFQKACDPNMIPTLKPDKKNKKIIADPRDIEIAQLKKELMQDRSEMRAVTEEQETANEELQSANQELLSSSEELQSLNEELETSKEELQSTNEEIIIVNNELINRNDQLNSARSYTEGIINTIRDPLIILDRDLKVMRATNGFYNKFKVTEEQTEGQFLYNLGNQQWDIPALRQLLESILTEEKTFADFEVAHVFPDIGRKIMLLNAQQLIKVTGESVILLAIEDITAQRKVEEGLAKVEVLFEESKERLKLAVDAAEMGTWDFNLVTKELVLDNRCKALLGISFADELQYNKLLALVHPDDQTAVDEAFKQAVAGANNGEYEMEYRIIQIRDEKPIWIKSKGKVYFDGEGVPIRFVGTSLDVTTQRLLDETTQELLKKKDDFMSIASHELKTPITSLKACLQLLDRIKDNPSAKMLPSLIERANKSMERINILIEDLLNVGKISGGHLQLNKTRFTIATLINDCCEHVHTSGIYSIITNGDLAAEVYADAERVDQVVINFVNNAMKYAPESKEININIAKANDFVKVSVIDKGPGIPLKKLPHLFERYYQADNSGNQYSGLGLGLYICAEIIKKHGGQIGVESSLGTGSTFWFTLPSATE